MKKQLLHILTAVSLLFLTNAGFAQAPNLGTVANFALFTSDGAVTNSGTSHVTGNVGSNSGAGTGFGNVNGVMYSQDSASAQCAKDLLKAYNHIDSAKATFFPSSSTLGNGDTLVAGVYSINSAATLNGTLFLNAKGNGNAIFIFQINGSFSTGAASKIKLINGAMACNVFWVTEGLIKMATGTSMKGTIIANNAAITMATGDTLEGRALSTTGAVGVVGVTVYTPIGCGSPTLKGPIAPNLGTTECYALFSGNGAVSNSGITNVIGDVGTNSGKTTGFNAKLVKGTIHTVPDASTAQADTDLGKAYNYLDSLQYDIQLLYPAQFGNNLVLTPHTYLLNAATVFTDSLYLNAQGDANAVFVIKIIGALSTSTYSNVILMNGAQSKNVYWLIEGAVGINNYSIFRGTIICDKGALGALNTGVVLDGRALTTGGALTTTAITAIMPTGCSSIYTGIVTAPLSQTACTGTSANFSVIATGSSLKYQWRKGSKNLTNGNGISGATTDSLTINPVTASDTASDYNVIISGGNGPADTSANVSLALNIATAITTAPGNVLSCAGNSVGFTVTAIGTGLKYQWRKGKVNLTNAGNIVGATSDMLTINSITSSDTASDYNVIISGTCSKDSSKNVSLKINAALAITTVPVNQSECTGSSANFSVVATGTGLTYQWRKGMVNLTNGGAISGATTASLVINPVSASYAATDYNVVITSPCSKDSSKNVSLAVNAATAIAITTVPVNQTECSGNAASFSVVATGTALIYQWRKGTVNLSNGAGISGATSDKLTINPVSSSDAGTDYNVVISGTCSKDSSKNVSLTVNAAIAITTLPVNQTECTGSSVSFSVVATGTGLTYQWRKGSVNLSNGAGISGATTDALTINPASSSDIATDYNVVISGACSKDSSKNVSLSLNIAPGIVTNPVGQTVKAGASASFSVAATGTALTYQWKKGNTDLTNGGNISGATSDMLTISNVTAADSGLNYNVVVSGTCSPAVTSKNAPLSVSGTTGIASIGAENDNMVSFFPNPFTASINVKINGLSQFSQCSLEIYNVLGTDVINTIITKETTTLQTGSLPSGMYFYKVFTNNVLIQSGKLIAQ